MPVVPPMVSASTGALLLPHAPAGHVPADPAARLLRDVRRSALVASAVVIALIWAARDATDVGEAATVPTLWIVLGPLGQSVTAANLLGGVAPWPLPAPLATRCGRSAIGLRHARSGGSRCSGRRVAAVGDGPDRARTTCRSALTWWSFTFPVGTVVTGTSGLALHTGSPGFAVAAAVLFVALVGAWLTVLARTARGCFLGRLFLPAGPAVAR